MKSTLTNFIFCAVGAAVGSLVTWKLTQEYYKKLADKEIADVKEAYDRVFKIAMKDEPAEEEEYQPTENDIRENASIIENQGYTQYSNIITEKDVKKVERPYLITPEEFSELYDYETISLIHFADGVLTDDQYELVEDVDDVVGSDYAEHFGEYEDDSVYIRNDRLKADFEILRDLRTRSEAINPSPHPTEDE